jgi:hypothetical protein
MILRLSLNEMDLQRSKQMLARLQRQPNHMQRIFGYGRATADLMNAFLASDILLNHETDFFVIVPKRDTTEAQSEGVEHRHWRKCPASLCPSVWPIPALYRAAAYCHRAQDGRVGAGLVRPPEERRRKVPSSVLGQVGSTAQLKANSE